MRDLPASVLRRCRRSLQRQLRSAGKGHAQRRQPKQQSGQRQHAQRKQQHRFVRSQAGFNLRPLAQQPRRHLRKAPRQRAARRHQDQALRQQLAEQLAAPRAQSLAH